MTRKASLVLKDVTLPDGRRADVSIQERHVAHIGSARSCDRVIDCSRYLVLPAATDIHVHMRGGIQAEKEDWATGSRSALAGGVTLVVDQPNTVPPLSTPEIFARRVEDARDHSACHFAINSALSEGISIRRMWEAGAMAFGETFFGPSSYGEIVPEEVLADSLRTISRLRGLVTIHAETVSRIGSTDLISHGRSRPVQGEIGAIRAVQDLNDSRCRLHFCHLSSGRAVDSVRTETVEVTPHHLLLSQESFHDSNGTYGKVNPPLRTEKTRKALFSRWERIDIIASDHAPHTRAEKEEPFSDAPSGIPGVETMMPLLVAKVLDHTLQARSLVEKTSENPARILGIQKPGFSPGDRADFALFPKVAEKVRAENLHSRCGWTPFEGMAAVFPSQVIMDGEPVFSDGDFFPGTPRWFPGNGYAPGISGHSLGRAKR